MQTKSICNLLTLLTLSVLSTQSYAVQFHKPIVVNNAYIHQFGRVITGNFSGTLTQPAISIMTTTPVIVRDATLQGPGDLIYVKGGDITVVNTTGTHTNPNVNNTQKGMFLNANFPTNVMVSNCTISGARMGIYVNGFAVSQVPQRSIRILNNTITNIDGRPSNGNGGYASNGDYIAHAIQLNNVPQIANAEIAWNSIVNAPGQGQSSDLISLYSSGGMQNNPFLIHDNYLQGAYPAAPGVDKIYTGGGITIDGSTSDTVATAPAFINVYNNHIVSTANYGLQIRAGHDNSIYNNRVISSGLLSNNTYYATVNAIGLNNVNFYNAATTVFFNNTIHDNTVGLIAVTTTGTPVRADWNLTGQNNAVLNNVAWTPNDNKHPTTTDEANELALWQNSIK